MNIPPAAGAFVVAVPVIVGLALLAVAARSWRRSRRLVAIGEKATAAVIGNEDKSIGEGRVVYRPVVRFTTRTGVEVTGVVTALGRNRPHALDSWVEVIFDPENPAEVAPASPPTTSLAVTAVAGLVFLGFALLAYQLIQPSNPS